MFSEQVSAHQAPESVTIPFPGGDLRARVSGRGRPVLLVHSINAAASHAEMDALARQLESGFRVYNLDLPGFGDSERPAVRHDIGRFVAAVETTVDAIRAAEEVDAVDIVALSLSCEFVARAAMMRPRTVRSLVLISPTGFQKGADKLTGPPGASLERPWLSTVLESPAGPLLYRGLTTRPSIGFFLRRTFGGPHVDPHVFEAAVRSVAEPGAEHAPLAFLSGRLFARDITTVYQALTLPIAMIHGTKGDFSDFTNAVWTESRPNWTREVHDTGALPHVERPAQVADSIRAFLASVGETAAGVSTDRGAPPNSPMGEEPKTRKTTKATEAPEIAQR